MSRLLPWSSIDEAEEEVMVYHSGRRRRSNNSATQLDRKVNMRAHVGQGGDERQFAFQAHASSTMTRWMR
jgi:hypothetical protein